MSRGWDPGSFMMRRIFAAMQILIVLAIITFSTWQLFQGNFAAGMASMPLLLIFYLFLSSRSKRG